MPTPGVPAKTKSPKPWTIEPLFKGEDVFVVGSGFSLKYQDPSVLRDRNVIVINHSCRWAPFAQVLFWMDRNFFEVANDQIRRWKGLAVTVCDSCKRDMPRKLKWIPMLRQQEGLWKEPNGIAKANSSVQGALNLAFHFGAKRIILLGVDMHVGYGQNSHFIDDVSERQPWRYQQSYIPGFTKIAADLEGAGVPVLNATPKSALETFSKVDLADVL